MAIWLVVDRAQHLGAAGRVDLSRETAAEGARLARAAGFTEGLARANWILGLAAEFQQDAAGPGRGFRQAVAAGRGPRGGAAGPPGPGRPAGRAGPARG